MRLEHRRSTKEYREELREIFDSEKTNIQETPSPMSIMGLKPTDTRASNSQPPETHVRMAAEELYKQRSPDKG